MGSERLILAVAESSSLYKNLENNYQLDKIKIHLSILFILFMNLEISGEMKSLAHSCIIC